jgi:Phage head-tail joining protein
MVFAYQAALDQAKALIQTTFNTSATVLRKTSTVDTSGGFADSYASVATLACSFSRYQVTPVERENTFTVQTIVEWMFVFPFSSDIRTTDRLVVGSRTFEVVSGASGSLEVATRVLALEIT